LVFWKVVVVSVEVPSEAACCVPEVACELLPFTVNVTERPPGSATALVAVTVLGPGVEPRMRTVLAVAAAGVPVVRLACGEKLSPGALLAQNTLPQGSGFTAGT